MDFLQARRRREWTLVGLVAIAAGLANLPHEFAQSLHLNTHYLVAVLGLLVLLGLFLYIRFTFFLLYALLVIGANLPEQWATGLGIAKMPMLIALGFMVAGSLVNYVVNLVPTGLEQKSKTKSLEGLKALSHYVDRGSLSLTKRVLDLDIDPNMLDEQGLSPLMRAAKTNQQEMVELLLHYGADPAMLGGDGSTAVILAERAGHTELADTLKAALRTHEPLLDSPLGPDSGFIKT